MYEQVMSKSINLNIHGLEKYNLLTKLITSICIILGITDILPT